MLVLADRLAFAVLTSQTLIRYALHLIGEQTKVNYRNGLN